MAEFVEFRAEEWLAELEQMERIRLFEQKDIKTIATKRREFEYKIQRRTKCKEDFIKYIQYEINLHRIIKARRKLTGIKTKRAEIDHSQTRRIANLFKQVIFKFQDDVILWMSFFKFCKGVKFYSMVSQMLVRMLQIHSNKDEVWVFAAKWEFKQLKSIDNARQYLTRGLRHHPSSWLLYEELFKMELEHLKRMKTEMEKKESENEGWAPDEAMKNVIEGKVVEVVYNSATKAIQGVEFKVGLLTLSKQKRAPTDIKYKILHDIIKNHLNEELTWDTVAREELKGIQCNLNEMTGEEPMEICIEKRKEKMTERDRIQRSINVYEEAVKRLNSPKMWGFYLNFVVELSENQFLLPVFKYNLMNKAMEDAISSGKMDENHYVSWIEGLGKLRTRPKKSLEVLKKGTQLYPNSNAIWYYYINFYFNRERDEKGLKIFKEAIKHLPDDEFLWSYTVEYLLRGSRLELEELFQIGIQRGGEVAQKLKPSYVEWLVKEKGIEEARKVLQSPEMSHPPCLPFYTKMIDLELKQPQISLEKVRQCYDLACSNFGKEDADLWLNYVKFELAKGDRSTVPQIYRRALAALNPTQADTFVSGYNKIKIDSV